MFHAIYHPNLWNYCQLISLFVSQYQPMINQTLRSSTNKQYSIPTFHLFTSPQILSWSICRLHSFTFCQSPFLYIVLFLKIILLPVNFLLKISPCPLPLLSVDHSCLFSAGKHLIIAHYTSAIVVNVSESDFADFGKVVHCTISVIFRWLRTT